MALCESPYGSADSPFAGSLAYPMTPPFTNTYPTASTPLMLPRDWSENYYMPSTSTSDAVPDNYDFQSNHLETTRLPFGIIPSLAGLGIRNVELDKETENKDLKFSSYNLGHLSPIQLHDSRRQSRAYRTDSINDAATGSNSFDTPQNQQTAYNLGTGSPWTLSSILRAAEFAASNATSELDQSLASGPALDPVTTSHLLDEPKTLGDGEGDVAWSFETLSAATGLSVADFAAQLSATAEATLKRMGVGDDLDVSSSSHSANIGDGMHSLMSAFSHNNEPLAWPPLSNETGLSLPFVDVNLRTLNLSWNTNCAGVDPADIMPNSHSSLSQFGHNSGDSSISSDFGKTAPPPLVLAVPQNTYLMDFNLPPDQPQSFPKAEVSSPPEEPYTLPLLKNVSRAREMRQASDDDAFQSPSSSEYSPFLQPLGSKRSHSSRVNTRRVVQQADPATSSLEYSNDINQQHLPPINLGTPVFDAHRGIDIEELKAKAERYRLRNQGRDYDKRWLISFAGKLSVRGELVEEFRCYVAGCKQVNKRRDHILIHVGAHLDQRPFKCLHCSARFLRKNECKRHELSHTGVRPFSCHLCPVPATTFVRQDLLKRHMKRTHRLELKIDKENEELPRPKKRAKF